MNSPDTPDTAANVPPPDRRLGSRESSLGQVQIMVEANGLTGTLENESPTGMFVVLDDAFQVEVVVDTGDGVRRSAARLARVTTLPGQLSGWGLELINDSSAA